MPADRRSARRGTARTDARSAEPSEGPAPVDPADSAAGSVDSVDSVGSVDSVDSVDSVGSGDSVDDEPAPLNRAERRGHGKRASNPQVTGRGKVSGRSSSVQGPRMWSNRRGGA